MECNTLAQNSKLYEELFFAVDKLDNLDILQDFLNENNLTEQFINSNIIPLWNGYRDEKLSKLENFSIIIGIDYLEDKFGTKFANKLQNAYSKKKINYLDVLSLIKLSDNKEILDNNKE